MKIQLVCWGKNDVCVTQEIPTPRDWLIWSSSDSDSISVRFGQKYWHPVKKSEVTCGSWRSEVAQLHSWKMTCVPSLRGALPLFGHQPGALPFMEFAGVAKRNAADRRMCLGIYRWLMFVKTDTCGYKDNLRGITKKKKKHGRRFQITKTFTCFTEHLFFLLHSIWEEASDWTLTFRTNWLSHYC